MGRQRYRTQAPAAAHRIVHPPYRSPVLWPGINWDESPCHRCPRAMRGGIYQVKIIDKACAVHGRLKNGETRQSCL